MMIRPETNYEMNLKGKNATQIMSAIRGLKKEVGHLKNVMENPDYGPEAIICPRESTRFWFTRAYLEKAKEALAEAGGVYEPSQAEIKAKEFEDNLPFINKIVFSIGRYFDGYTERTIMFNNEMRVCVTQSLAFDKEPLVPAPFPVEKDEFWDELRCLHIGEWRKSYKPERFGGTVLDGTQWE